MKTGDFIDSLAKQSGITLTDDQTKAIQEIATDLPDEVVTQIQGSLLTKESALANPDIINKLKAESLDPIDQKIKDFAKVAGLDEGFLHNLGETKGTYKRFEAVQKAILDSHKVALEKAKAEAKPGDKEGLQLEIDKLNTQILGMNDTHIPKTDYDTKVSEYENQIKANADNLLNMNIKGLFSGANWAMDVPTEVNQATAMGLLSNELNSKELSLVNENGTLKLQTKEGSPYYLDNKAVTPQDFANSILSGNKLLKVTSTTSPSVTPNTIVNTASVDPSVAAAVAKALQANADIVAHGTQV